MTNGVFDILHAGHVSYLANARKLGDRLIVAVNSDASTKRLSESRPVNPLEQRMIVLGALESVDWVVSFEEDTPQRLIAGIPGSATVKAATISRKRSRAAKGLGQRRRSHGAELRRWLFHDQPAIKRSRPRRVKPRHQALQTRWALI